MQYSRLANWLHVGKVPAHGPINLATEIRPELDQLQRELVRELADAAATRTSPACRAETAKAVDRYLAAHTRDAGPLQEIALGRAMAAICT